MSPLRLAARRPGSRSSRPPLAGVRGRARVDRRTSAVLGRIRPGEIAVLDHPDLDRHSAEELVASGVAAVVNASPCLTGRYPALGARVLVDAGVPLLDAVGAGVFAAVRDGRMVQLDGDLLRDGDLVLARGYQQSGQTVGSALASARAGLQAQANALTASASELLQRHPGLLLDPVPAPDLATRCAGRPLLVVQHGPDDRRDLAGLRRWIREARPVVVGVGDGAQVVLDAGLRPDILVGNPSELPPRALRLARDVVIPELPDGPPALLREDLAANTHLLPCLGGGEHAALILADALQVQVVVCVGARQGLLELLDQRGGEAAATVLGRLRAGHRLVDARAVTVLHRRRVPLLSVLLLAVAALAVVVAALTVAGDGAALGQLTGGWGRHLAHLVGRAGAAVRGLVWHRTGR